MRAWTCSASIQLVIGGRLGVSASRSSSNKCVGCGGRRRRRPWFVVVGGCCVALVVLARACNG